MTATDASDVPTLRDLLLQYLDERGHSQNQLALRSGIKSQTFSRWRAGDLATFPDPETMRAFAAATGNSEQAVLLAAARTLGLRVDSTSGLAQLLPPAADRLAPEQQRAVLSVIEAMTGEAKPEPVSDLPRPRYLHEVDAAAREDHGDPVS